MLTWSGERLLVCVTKDFTRSGHVVQRQLPRIGVSCGSQKCRPRVRLENVERSIGTTRRGRAGACAGIGQARGRRRRATPSQRRPRGGHALEEVGTVPRASGSGGRSARTTARPVTPGTTSPTIRLVRAPTGGARTGSAASRTRTAAVLRARALERARSDSEGAPVRADQQRVESRRGRQGVLLLRRLDRHALVHEVPLQVSAAGIPVPGSRGGQPAAVADGVRVRVARHGVFDEDRYFDVFLEYAKAGAGRHPRSRSRSKSRARGSPAPRAADALVPQYVVVGKSGDASR